MTPIGNLIRQAIRKENDPLNILIFTTHERYESLLARTNHNFYAIKNQRSKDWVKIYEPIPKNYNIFHNELPIDIDVDLIFTLSKHQYKEAHQLSKTYHVPLLCLEVFIPQPGAAEHILDECRLFMRGDKNVFINNYSKEVWGWKGDKNGIVIEHGIDTDFFCLPEENTERIPQIVSSVNDWVNRDWSHGFHIWRHITQGLPVLPLGNTPGLSRAVSIENLRDALQKSNIFINTTKFVPVPTALLEAMSCGCAVISTATGGIPEFIVNGENGFISNDLEELRSYANMLLDDNDLCRELGNNARKTILEKFNLPTFINNWNKVFHETVGAYSHENKSIN